MNQVPSYFPYWVQNIKEFKNPSAQSLRALIHTVFEIARRATMLLSESHKCQLGECPAEAVVSSEGPSDKARLTERTSLARPSHEVGLCMT